MSQITFNDKVTLASQPDVARENKVTDDDINEIKQVVNTNDPFFKNGDTFIIQEDSSHNIPNRLYINGLGTSSSTEINFTLTFNKDLTNISNVVINTLKMNVRSNGNYVETDSGQGYISGGKDFNVSPYVVSTYIIEKNLLTINIKKSSGSMNNLQNNAPVALEINYMTLTFLE